MENEAMNEPTTFPLAVLPKAAAAFDPFLSQSALGERMLNAPAAATALKDYIVDAASAAFC